jgi:hypothetical protein
MLNRSLEAPAGSAARDQAFPFQCKISAAPPADPAAQALVADVPLTELRLYRFPELPMAGTGTCRQVLPFQ